MTAIPVIVIAAVVAAIVFGSGWTAAHLGISRWIGVVICIAAVVVAWAAFALPLRYLERKRLERDRQSDS